jgi:hypothetical protein
LPRTVAPRKDGEPGFAGELFDVASQKRSGDKAREYGHDGGGLQDSRPVQADRRGFLSKIEVEIGTLIGGEEQGAEGYEDRFGWTVFERGRYGIGKACYLVAHD